MFPRRERLSRAVLPTIIKNGRRFSSAHFVAIFPRDVCGYAVIVPKKVARLSVARHSIKRRVLHALRAISPPKALVLFPKATVANMDYKSIKDELGALCSKIG